MREVFSRVLEGLVQTYGGLIRVDWLQGQGLRAAASNHDSQPHCAYRLGKTMGQAKRLTHVPHHCVHLDFHDNPRDGAAEGRRSFREFGLTAGKLQHIPGHQVRARHGCFPQVILQQGRLVIQQLVFGGRIFVIALHGGARGLRHHRFGRRINQSKPDVIGDAIVLSLIHI